MKLFSVEYWPDKLRLSQEHIPAKRSNEYYVPCGDSKVVVDAACVQLLPLQNGGQAHFLANDIAVSLSEGKPQIEAGSSEDALVHITHLPCHDRSAQYSFLKATGLDGDQVIVGNFAEPNLITLKPGQEIAFHGERREMVWQRKPIEKGSLLYWCGMRGYNDRVERKTEFTFYMMFDGDDLRIYSPQERVN